MRRCAAAVILLLFISAGTATSISAADLARGRALYENHCTVCHTPRIHTRPNRLPLNVEELQQIVIHWAKEEDLRWSQDDIADVVWYLNVTKYRY